MYSPYFKHNISFLDVATVAHFVVNTFDLPPLQHKALIDTLWEIEKFGPTSHICQACDKGRKVSAKEAAATLASAFPWIDSPQGHNAWQAVYMWMVSR